MATNPTGEGDSHCPADPALEADLPALVWHVGPERGADAFNDAWTSLSGLAREQLSGDGWLELVHADDRPKLAVIDDPSALATPFSLDVRIRDRSGRFRWFLVSCGRPGRASRRALVALPIDSRKSAELDTELELSHVRAMLDNAPAMLWRTTAAGEMDYANERYLRAWGRSLDEVRGWGWKDSVHPDDRQGLIDYWDAHRFSAGDGMYEFRVGSPERGYRWCLSVCSPRLDGEGQVREWYGATFDIEARKQAEERLRRSEAFLRHGQMISRTGSIALNRVTGEHHWSEETYRIFGLDPSATPGLEAVLARVHPEDLAQVRGAIRRIEAGERDVKLEHRAVMPDGRVKHLLILVNPAHAEDDGDNVSGVIMDVTAAKLAEEEMHRAQADLTRVTRIATMSELTASIAHEINQPISGILTNSEACLRWINRPEPDLAEAREAVERAVLGARRVSEVVRQLRAIFAREASQPSRFTLGSVVRSTLPLLRAHMSQHRASVAIDLADGEPTILGDRVQVQQVLINLVM
ncbi:MAG TPA: PAS domain-containing protein, partial [Thermoanaerobaculia bacterium]|nr:PAS domain-containing protein [Thermoanaerobaculia bacterium]